MVTGLIALLGVIVGAGIAGVFDYLTQRRQAKAALDAAAFRCLARLKKIRDADAVSDSQQRANEIGLLGGDMDSYVVAIGTAPDSGARARHWTIYEQLIPVLMRQETGGLEELIGELERELTAGRSGRRIAAGEATG